MKLKQNNLFNIIILTASIFLSIPGFAESHTIQMKSISFDPKNIDIKVGDSIQWVNTSYTEHSATAFIDEKNTKPTFDTGMVKPKKSSEKIIFKTAGQFMYSCQVHGKTMTGKVNVTQ